MAPLLGSFLWGLCVGALPLPWWQLAQAPPTMPAHWGAGIPRLDYRKTRLSRATPFGRCPHTGAPNNGRATVCGGITLAFMLLLPPACP